MGAKSEPKGRQGLNILAVRRPSGMVGYCRSRDCTWKVPWLPITHKIYEWGLCGE
jgi:hypothetical protein